MMEAKILLITVTFREDLYILYKMFIYFEIFPAPSNKHVQSNFNVRKNNRMQMSVLFNVDVNIVYYKFDFKKSESLLY